MVSDLLIVTKNDSNINKLWFVYINYFRVGEFDNAPKFLQDAWCQFCQHILMFVNKKFNCKVTQLHTAVSQVCSISDEAFAMEIGNTHMCHWIYHYINRKDKSNQYVPVNINPIEYDDDYFKKGNSSYGTPADEDDDDDETNKIGVADNVDANNDNEDDNHDDDEDDNHDDEDDDEDDNNEDQDIEDKDTEGKQQNTFDACDDKVKDDQKQYNKLITQSYYANCSKLQKIKTNKYEEWMSWDNGFRRYINKAKVPSEVDVTEKENGVIAGSDHYDAIEVEYEPW